MSSKKEIENLVENNKKLTKEIIDFKIIKKLSWKGQKNEHKKNYIRGIIISYIGTYINIWK